MTDPVFMPIDSFLTPISEGSDMAGADKADFTFAETLDLSGGGKIYVQSNPGAAVALNFIGFPGLLRPDKAKRLAMMLQKAARVADENA